MTDVADETVLVDSPATGDEPGVQADPPLDRGPNTARSVPPVARVLGAVGRFLITTGVVVFLFIAYELWGTNIQEARAQRDLRTALDDRFAAVAALPDPELVGATVIDAGGTGDDPDVLPTPSSTLPGVLPTPSSTLPGGYDPSVLELFFPSDGEALAKIELPSLGVEKIVVRGVDVADLRKGPGHYPGTPVPGDAGNSGIAGHRTTYGAPFNRIDELTPGDEIVVTGVQGEFTYRVMDPREAYAGFESDIESFDNGHIIVRPGAVWVLGDFGDNRLTLTACHPKLSARRRIIVAAELVDEPVLLPEWAEKAQAELLAGPETTLGADEVFDGTTPDDTNATGTATAADTNATGTATAADTNDTGTGTVTAAEALDLDLDHGLSGERDAIPGAVAWMVGAIAFWMGGGLLGRRRRRSRWSVPGWRLAGLAPAFVCLWFAFEMIDRALPAA